MGKGLSEKNYFLVDNGSLRAESVRTLREIAGQLSSLCDLAVIPMGLMHSHKVDVGELDGQPAQSMQSFLESAEAETLSHICVIPFFLGPSLAVTDWLPRNLARWQERGAGRHFRILDVLYRPGDDRLPRALVDRCREVMHQSGLSSAHVALVDHGTPLKEVNQVREEVGLECRHLLAKEVAGFSTCAMERREGAEYDFNDPLLESLLEKWAGAGVREIILSQFFLLPGRHAGPGGDLEQIVQPFTDRLPELSVYRADNLGTHPLVMDILRERMTEAVGVGA
jgi:sirohydrochlorin ferrochelatase